MSSPNPRVLFAINSGLQAINLCSNKIIQFLTRYAALQGWTCVLAIEYLLYFITRYLLCYVTDVSVFRLCCTDSRGLTTNTQCLGE